MSKEYVASITRRNFTKLAGASVAALSLGGVLVACSGTSDSQETSGENSTATNESAGQGEGQDAGQATSQVIIALSTEAEPAAGFNPFVAWGCGGHKHEPLIQSTLIKTDVDFNFVNDLATSYETSDDGLTWTFTIRNDVKFTDGEQLTASDVAFTLNGIANNAAAECDLSMMDEAVATDDITVEIYLNEPYNALLFTLEYIGIVPEHAYDENYGSNPIGSGRYMLEQWDKGQQFILMANPDYYGETPKMQRVVVVFMEEDAALAAAQASEVDVAYTSTRFAYNQPANYDLLNCDALSSRGVSLPVVEPGNTRIDAGVTYDAGNAVTCDLAIRQAINYGIDRELMINQVLNGFGEPAYSACDGMPWYSSEMECTTDVNKANQLLEDGGWILGEDAIREKGGQRASLDVYYDANDSMRQAVAENFKSQLADLGIEVNVHGTSWDEIYLHQYSDPVVWNWGTNSPIELYNLYHSDSSANYACYGNATVDSYLDEALAQPTVEESYEYWKKAQWDGTCGVAPQGDAPWVWFVKVEFLYFVREGLQIPEQKPQHGHGMSLLNNVDQWSWA